MAKLNVTLTPKNIAFGVGFVVLGLALFTWLLPLLLSASLIYTVAGVVVGTLVWFLFLLSRS